MVSPMDLWIQNNPKRADWARANPNANFSGMNQSAADRINGLNRSIFGGGNTSNFDDNGMAVENQLIGANGRPMMEQYTQAGYRPTTAPLYTGILAAPTQNAAAVRQGNQALNARAGIPMTQPMQPTPQGQQTTAPMYQQNPYGQSPGMMRPQWSQPQQWGQSGATQNPFGWQGGAQWTGQQAGFGGQGYGQGGLTQGTYNRPNRRGLLGY